MDFKELLSLFNESFTFFCVFPALIILGAYLTIKLRFVQITKIRLSFSYLLKKDPKSQGQISHFEAISAVLAGNFGTGNISGMAVAISTGGPGALVWMWVMAFFGAAIQYASCILGVKYRQKNQDGEYMGGPMYYLEKGLGWKKLGVLFAILTTLGAITAGNFAQVNSMTLPLAQLGIDPLFSGLAIALFVGLVIFGGLKRMAKIASLIVPVKAFLYLGFALIILLLNIDKVIPALQLMYIAAIDPSAVMGGVLGMGVLKALTTGFDRGIFATDAGTGIVPILQSSAKTQNPVTDGIVTLATPLCVMIVCTMTGLVLLVSGAWQQTDLKSTNMVTYAFETGLGHSVGSYVVSCSLILFGYTTILAWGCCAEKAMHYLVGKRFANWYKYLYLALIPVGALIHVDLIWTLADICITTMLITNIAGVAFLSKQVIRESNNFFAKKEPLLSKITLEEA
ncbi:MAG: sodium:alanine symporter family protein [Chlamydiales bacterium]|nr:sodium:alanine symporter family protein [Chlamydiales bacterium]